MANSVDPAVCSGSTLFASILNSSVMLGNYLQQTTSADDIFRCIFFLGALRVKLPAHILQSSCILYSYFFSVMQCFWVCGSMRMQGISPAAYKCVQNAKQHSGHMVTFKCAAGPIDMIPGPIIRPQNGRLK